MHEEARDPVLRLPRELALAGPVAPETDLHVARTVDVTVAHEPVHRRPVRDLDAEDLLAGIRMGVEVDEGDRPVHRRNRLDVGLGDRVVAAEDDRDRARRDDLPDDSLDRRVIAGRIGGHDGRVTEVDDAELRDRIEAGLQMRAWRAAGGANGARPEPGARPVGGEIVHRRADDRDVDSLELRGILGRRQAGERQQPGVVGLVGETELTPPLERIEHDRDPTLPSTLAG